MHKKLLFTSLLFIISFSGFSSQIALSDTTKISTFNLQNTNESLTWLGVDCSLYKIKSNKNIAQDDKIKETLLDGISYFHNRHMNKNQLAGWLGIKKERLISKIEFGKNQTKINLPKHWILPSCECYYLRRENIIDYIKTYKIEGSGIALVFIPELTNMHEHINYSWIVFFDLETKNIIWMNRYTTTQKLNSTPRKGHFGTEWMIIMKDFIDGEYQKKLY